MSKEEFVADAPPAPAWWHKKTVPERIDEMKLRRRLVIKRLKQAGWSKDEIRDVAWIITKKIRAWEKLRGVNLRRYDIATWLREG